MTTTSPVLAVLGGTGNEGGGLATRWAAAGYTVIIGGREAAKAQAMADDIRRQIPAADIRGCANAEAAAACDIAILTVPYAAQQPTALSVASALQGKILVDVTVPLVPPRVSQVQLPPEGAAAVALQRALGPEVRVVSAFQNISAHHLRDLDHDLDCDVLVTGDDPVARDVVASLVQAAGMTGIVAGPLCNAVVAEALTSVLIAINRRYKVPAAGIRITGLTGAS